jgi:hypothetical protein
VLLIDQDLMVLRCTQCRALIDIPTRDQAPYSRVAFRDRTSRTHPCTGPVKQERQKKSWVQLFAAYADQLTWGGNPKEIENPAIHDGTTSPGDSLSAPPSFAGA